MRRLTNLFSAIEADFTLDFILIHSRLLFCIQWPVTTSGPMADPIVQVDMQGLVVEAVKETARGVLMKRLGLEQRSETPASPDAGPPRRAA
jgi:hypothetical protein